MAHVRKVGPSQSGIMNIHQYMNLYRNVLSALKCCQDLERYWDSMDCTRLAHSMFVCMHQAMENAGTAEIGAGVTLGPSTWMKLRMQPQVISCYALLRNQRALVLLKHILKWIQASQMEIQGKSGGALCVRGTAN